MKTKTFLLLLISLILVTTFFIKIIPVPVESPEGGLDKENFIYGGIYWTSGLYELSVGSPSFLYYTLIFTTLFFAIYLMEFEENGGRK